MNSKYTIESECDNLNQSFGQASLYSIYERVLQETKKHIAASKRSLQNSEQLVKESKKAMRTSN